MCLGVPGRVISVQGRVATVDFWGVRRDVQLHIIDEPVEPGDYILNHVGFAVRRIAPAEVERTVALFEELLAAQPGDLLAAEVRSQIGETDG